MRNSKKSVTLTEMMIGLTLFMVFSLTLTGIMFFGRSSLTHNMALVDALQSSRNSIVNVVKEIKMSRIDHIRISTEAGTIDDLNTGSVLHLQIPLGDFSGIIDISAGELVWGDGNILDNWIAYYVDNENILRRAIYDSNSVLLSETVIAIDVASVRFTKNGNDLIDVNIRMLDGIT